MFITLIVLSTAGLKVETPVKPTGRLECLNPVKSNPKQEMPSTVGTEKCLAVPDKTAPNRKVQK